MRKVKVFKKIPGGIWMVDFIENTLEGFQAAVGGYIETVTPCSDLTIVCNEEGRLMDLEPCCKRYMKKVGRCSDGSLGA